jgi:hypothetical protein
MRDDRRMPLMQVRVNQDVLDGLRELVPLVQKHPNWSGGLVMIQDVYRLALARGLDALRREMREAGLGED